MVWIFKNSTTFNISLFTYFKLLSNKTVQAGYLKTNVFK